MHGYDVNKALFPNSRPLGQGGGVQSGPKVRPICPYNKNVLILENVSTSTAGIDKLNAWS